MLRIVTSQLAPDVRPVLPAVPGHVRAGQAAAAGRQQVHLQLASHW